MKNWIILLLIMTLTSWISNIYSQIAPAKKSAWEQELETRDPSKPLNFGHKWIWAAVKTEETDTLLQLLNLKNLVQCNWVEGTLKAGQGYVFVLPPVSGWTLISGLGLPAPGSIENIEETRRLLNQLSQRFGEAQLFGNHRVSSTAFWMKSVNGALERLYYIGDGTNFIEGKSTAVETQWDLIDTNAPEAATEAYWDKMVYPEAEHVLKVAESWSINPMKLEEFENIGAYGYVGIFRKKN